MRKVIHMDSSKMVLSEDSGKTIIITVDNVENIMRSEFAANLSLQKTEQPTWQHASRCNRRQHTALQIAQRHPSLFQRLFGYLLRK